MLPFLESVMTEDWVHWVGHFPVYQILLQIVMRAVITSSPPAWTSSVGMLLTQLTSLSSVIVLQPPLLCEGWVVVVCVSHHYQSMFQQLPVASVTPA